MSRWMTITIRAVLLMVFAGAVLVHTVMVPLLAADLSELADSYSYIKIPTIVLAIIGVLTIEVIAVCVWQLVSMTREGTVFSRRAFRYVDVTIASICVAAACTFAFGALLAPGEAVAPGIVLLIGGIGILITGVALIVVVLRALLTQAIATKTEASHLKAELDEVI